MFLVPGLLAVWFFSGSPAGPQGGLRSVHDVRDGLTFAIPIGWGLAARDRELSTFRQEARSAPAGIRFRYVAAMPENPYPASTFSGAHFYVSATPGESAAACRAEAGAAVAEARVGNLAANHGHDEHGGICTEFRDEVYTVRHNGSCVRFDLAMNNFCGGEVTGVRDLTPGEMLEIRRRLESILATVQFDR